MLFQTWDFLVFFLVVLALYAALRRTRLRLAVLLAASYIFYAWWDLRFLVFLGIVTTADYLFGRGIAVTEGRRKKVLLWGSCLVNLSLLGAFKYLGFLTENLQNLLALCHIQWEAPEFDWLLPVGLSFFTFKSLSYTCDVYFGKIRCERNFFLYAAYVAFFPQLVAGPIERASTLLPQLRHRMPLSGEDLAAGFSVFFTGLFKKAVLADLLALYVDRIYEDPTAAAGASLLTAAIAYSWQIYFDFAGYSDMARGVARILGFRLMLNFDNPYTSVDIRDFWRKWHISLSSWFKDHVYIPMGGGRCVKYRVWWNVMVTMVVSGFWHGAAWNFIIWGALNGLGSILSPRSDRDSWYGKVPRLIRQLITFLFITVTWVFFKKGTVPEALAVLRRSVSCQPGIDLVPVIPLILVLVIWIWQLIYDSPQRRFLTIRPVRLTALAVILVLLFALSGGSHEQFIYFQF